MPQSVACFSRGFSTETQRPRLDSRRTIAEVAGLFGWKGRRVTYVLILACLLGGTVLQRLAGIGFGLFASPLLVLALGPGPGVAAVVICGGGASVLLLVQQWRAVEWRASIPLAVGGAVGVVPGVAVHSSLPGGPLQMTIGIVTLVLLGVVILLDRFRRSEGESNRSHSLLASGITGITAGAINVIAGVGGVPLSVFAVLTRWRAAAFAASSQFVFAVMCVATIAGLATVGDLELPTFTAAQWVGAAAAILIGVAMGPWLARHTSHKTGRRIMLVTAGAGAIASLIKGMTML